ncbi:MAG: sodium:solute symporter [Saprospiraceae bacterium]|nr:sodium:solute symporter [Saprospiraceae bacterium]MDW8229266.1 sodium:solute symporter [Saprospiraceae bacterium]
MGGHLTPGLVLSILLLYFVMLAGVALLTGRNVGNEGFFLANRRVPWYVVAYAMIGTSISGVTFVSVPGAVGLETGLNRGFGYMQVVFGYLLGYLFIATVLMPMYYRLQLTSIYTYLEHRLGYWSYKTGAAFFLLSRTLGSATRMFLAAMVLQSFVFEPLGVPFMLTVIFMLALIYGYTFKGGLKTIIWTDTIMTTFFLIAVVWTVITVGKTLSLDVLDIWPAVRDSRYGQMFFWDNFAGDPNHFVKQFVSGALIAIVMTGMDQDLMQKNLACKDIRAAQKNMFVFCIYLVIINLAFLTLGALLYMYATTLGIEIPQRTDELYPKIAFRHLETAAGVFFVLGLIASTYASSDSALTALTTSFCVDFLNFEKKRQHPDPYATEEEKRVYLDATASQQRRARTLVHLGFSVAFVIIILLLKAFSSGAVITLIFKIAGYTYGPLLGLYSFGLFTRRKLHPWALRLPRPGRAPIAIPAVVLVCVLAPLVTWLIEIGFKAWFDVGFLTILINGLLTFTALWVLSYRPSAEARSEPS